MGYTNEQLFNAIDIILNQRLQNLSYNKTIIGVVIDDSRKNENWYRISSDNIKFNAYSENQIYNIGDQVRIQIINGDFSDTKFIEGIYVSE